MQGQDQHAFKGQARRLRTALAELQLTVTHAAALNLIARAQGEKTWEALAAMLAGAAPAAQAADDAEHRFLVWLEAALRMQGYREEKFDETLYELCGDEEASRINNQGVYAQLQALLAHQEKYRSKQFSGPQEALLWDLSVNAARGADLPQLEGDLSKHYVFVPMRVSVCEGSSFERTVQVDALEWLCAIPGAQAQALAVAGLRNTEQSDEAAIWLAKNSVNPWVRLYLEALLAHCRSSQVLNHSVVGVTVDIDEDSFNHYLGVMQLRQAANA